MALPKADITVTEQVRTAFVVPACVGCGDAADQSGYAQSAAEAKLAKQKFFEVRTLEDGSKKLVQKRWCCKACWDSDPEVLALRADAASRSTRAERLAEALEPSVADNDLPF